MSGVNEFSQLSQLLITDQIFPRALSLEQTKLVKDTVGDSLISVLIRKNNLPQIEEFCLYGLDPFARYEGMALSPYDLSKSYPEVEAFFLAYTRPEGAPCFQSERQENFENVLNHVLACRYVLNNAHPSIEPWIRADRKGVNLLKLLIDGRTLQQSLNSSKIEAKDFFSRFLIQLSRFRTHNFFWKLIVEDEKTLRSPRQIIDFLKNGLDPNTVLSSGISLLEIALETQDQETVSWLLDWGACLENGKLTIETIEEKLASSACRWNDSLRKLLRKAIEDRRRCKERPLDNILLSSIYFGRTSLLEEYVKFGLPQDAVTSSGTSLQEICSLSLEPKMEEYLGRLYSYRAGPRGSATDPSSSSNPSGSLGPGVLLDDPETDSTEDGGKDEEEPTSTGRNENDEAEGNGPEDKEPNSPSDLDAEYRKKIQKYFAWPKELNGLRADFLKWIESLPLEPKAKMIYRHFISGKEENCPYPLSKELVIMARMLRQSFLSLISENEPD